MISNGIIQKAIENASISTICIGMTALIGYVIKRLFDERTEILEQAQSCTNKKESVENYYQEIQVLTKKVLEAQSVSTREISRRLSEVEKQTKKGG